MAGLLSDNVRPLGLPVYFVLIATKLNLDPPPNISLMVTIIVPVSGRKTVIDAQTGRPTAAVCFALAFVCVGRNGTLEVK